MPKTKKQKLVFSLLMSFLMVYGMEVYNHLMAANMTAQSFWVPVLELLGLMAIVIFLQTFIGGPISQKITGHLFRHRGENPFFRTLTMQIFTVCVMCPMMSFVAMAIFKGDVSAPWLEKWGQTIAMNLPMAMVWQLAIAGPLARTIVKKVKV